MKLRKKPVVIEAWPVYEIIDRFFNPGGMRTVDIPVAVGKAWAEKQLFVYMDHLSVVTLEGFMRADLTDMLICGIKGELYPCKPDIFEATYEAAE